MLKKPTKNVIPKKILLSLFMLFCLSSQSLFAVHDYINALYLTTYFYGAQRCGNTSSWIHGACHVKDGQAQGLDLTGGWHDCGDHVTFGQTAPYSAGVLLEGYLLKPASYKDTYSPANSAPPSNGIPDVLDEVKIFTDFLLKAYSGGRVYYQKGDGTLDHKHMCEPRDYSLNYTVTEGGESDGSRPMTSCTSGASNIMGDSAAALALMAIAYQPYDAAYATQCYNMAKNYFTVGDTSPAAVGAAGGFYPAANWQDDMGWGAATIYRASVARGAPEASYLTKATTYVAAGQTPGSWPLCYDHTEFLGHYNLYKISGAAADLTWMTNDVTYYKGKMVTCGTGSYAWVTGWGSLRYAANMAFAAALLHSVSNVAADYTFVKNNVDFTLGTHGDVAGSPNCPAGRSFVVGYTNPDNAAAGSVAHPHHRAAFGKTKAGGADTLWASENTSPGSVPYAYVLKGALVGGPQASCSNYNDRIDDYVANEVGVDYNAGLVGAIAYVISVQNPSTPTYTPTPNLSWTRTRTPTITPTYTQSPIPPPTNKLNLQVMTNGSSENCTTQTFGFEYRITNWETTVVSTSNMAIKIWLDTTDTIAGSIYNARRYDSGGTDLGTITPAIAEGAGLGCGGATKSVLITVPAVDIPANGGYIMIQGSLNRAAYSTPFDAGCNDYTKMLATWTTYQNNSTQTLWQGTNLVCEYINASTQDTSTGLHPCTGGNGCGVAGTPTRTPSRTMTGTPTYTRTNTVQPPTSTYTRTRTPTYTRTPTPTYTSTRTSTVPPATSTYTRTVTPTYTRTNTNTLLNTPTFTSTRSSTVPPATSTYTRTVTPTYTRTGTNTPVNTQTFTSTRTASATASVLPSNTFTRTPTASVSPQNTFTYTSTRTNTVPPATSTYTRTVTPTYTRTSTNTPVNTSTFTSTRTQTPTYTVTVTQTFTGTPTFTRTPTPTHTRTRTSTPSPTISNTWTPGYGTLTNTPTITQSATASVSPTVTWTNSVSPTRTATPSATATSTGTASPTFSRTVTLTHTAVPTFTFTVTASPSASGTPTFTSTLAPSPSNTPTRTVTPTFTLTLTLTLTNSPTFTRTMTYTRTFTATGTYTRTASPTNTATPTASISPTYSVSPTFTESPTGTPPTRTVTPTVTRTYTDTATNTVTRTETPTVTMTVTDTETATDTVTPSETSTPADTETATPTRTAEDTVIPTASETEVIVATTPVITATLTFTAAATSSNTVVPTATGTFTGTRTVTPLNTATRTDTGTFTRTRTSTPVNTITITQTVFLSPTPTNTPTIQPERQAITDLLPFPNPVNPLVSAYLYIGFTAARIDSDSIKLKIYTSGQRLVRTVEYKGTDAQNILIASRFRCEAAELSGLANGTYYYMLTAEKAGEVARSKVDKIVILK
jgi:hypothetical protein